MRVTRGLKSRAGIGLVVLGSACGDSPLAATDAVHVADAAVPHTEVTDGDMVDGADGTGGTGDMMEAADSGLMDVTLTPDALAPDTRPGDTDLGPIDDSPLGGDRPAALVLPEGLDPSVPTPVVMLLHGFSASGTLQDLYLGVSETAKARGFATIIPEGTRNSAGVQFWNAAPAWCCDFEGSGVDDAGYLLGLLDELGTRMTVDARRVYLIGHSNGGFMSHRLACGSSRIAAIASIAGSLPLDDGGCDPASPVSVLQIHGTLDATILYGGALGQYPAAETVTERWARHDGCQTLPVEGERVDFDNVIFGDETTPLTYPACTSGFGVTLWRMFGSGHVPGFTSEFMPAVLDWLEAHPRPE